MKISDSNSAPFSFSNIGIRLVNTINKMNVKPGIECLKEKNALSDMISSKWLGHIALLHDTNMHAFVQFTEMK